MGRQLFLHHYLPAHLASCLVAGATVEFITNVESPEPPSAALTADAKKSGKLPVVQRLPLRERIANNRLLFTWSASAGILAVLVWGFWFFAPLTYGNPGLTVDQVLARKWLPYDFHFAK